MSLVLVLYGTYYFSRSQSSIKMSCIYCNIENYYMLYACITIRGGGVLGRIWPGGGGGKECLEEMTGEKYPTPIN